MANVIEIPDLWGNDINVEVVSPATILKVQAEKLSLKTKGVLLARTYPSGDGCDGADVTHHLELHAPAINYTEEVLAISHVQNRAYPVVIRMPASIAWERQEQASTKWCGNEEEFMQALRTALRSYPVRSAIDSILAESNERNLAPVAS